MLVTRFRRRRAKRSRWLRARAVKSRKLFRSSRTFLIMLQPLRPHLVPPPGQRRPAPTPDTGHNRPRLRRCWPGSSRTQQQQNRRTTTRRRHRLRSTRSRLLRLHTTDTTPSRRRRRRRLTTTVTSRRPRRLRPTMGSSRPPRRLLDTTTRRRRPIRFRTGSLIITPIRRRGSTPTTLAARPRRHRLREWGTTTRTRRRRRWEPSMFTQATIRTRHPTRVPLRSMGTTTRIIHRRRTMDSRQEHLRRHRHGDSVRASH